MRGRFFAIVVVAAAGALVLAACAPLRRNAPPPVPRTALWKVTSAQRTLFVTGDADASLKKYPVPPSMTKAFADSAELVLEADVNPPKDQANLAGLIMKLGRLPVGQKLSDKLNAAQLKVVKQAFTEAHLPFARFEGFEPWLAITVLVKASVAKSGIAPHQLFKHFDEAAEARKLPVTYLDTASQELRLMAGMPEQAQVSFLMITAKEYLKPKDPAKRAALVKSWREGNVEPMARYFASQFRGYSQVYELTITSRHARWIKTLSAMLSKPGQPVFVVVGSAHLFGNGNLLTGLRNAGYHVVQL